MYMSGHISMMWYPAAGVVVHNIPGWRPLSIGVQGSSSPQMAMTGHCTLGSVSSGDGPAGPLNTLRNTDIIRKKGEIQHPHKCFMVTINWLM